MAISNKTEKGNTDTSWQNIAEWYKDVPIKNNSYHNTVVIPNVLSVLKDLVPKKAKILDIACGEGTITNKISLSGYKVAGADMSQKLIDIAKHNYPETPFFKEDARALSGGFIKLLDTVDCVICILALQNIDNINAVFDQIKIILKNKGVFIFIINHPYFRIPKVTSWGFDGLKKQFRIVEKYLSDLKLPILTHPGKPNSEVSYSYHRPLKEYVKLLHKHGFSIIDIQELISNKQSEPGKRAEAENEARKEIPLFMTVVAKLSK